MRTLVAIPVYNEEHYVDRVMARVLEFAERVLVIDDGSTDATPCRLPSHPVEVIRHATNRGYGRSMQDAFRWAMVDGYDWVITMDCDEQHEPESIPDFIRAAQADTHDLISGSRYLNQLNGNDTPPENRRAINATLTKEINERLGLNITDAFCGFKAYRVDALRRLSLSEDGYAFPMQFWVQAVAHNLRITEIPIRLIYKDPKRTFGGPLNDDDTRLAYYRRVLERELTANADRLPESARTTSWCSCCCKR
ncbi:MAG: glycosyltransferase family 2 protein [Phycisphaerales bacterium]|nr:glycosyltransferase family 2 protein [Phycisphaerales bacterium]